MALTISTGFVVDDAIVMVENIARFLEEGDTPMQAALKGADNRLHDPFADGFTYRGPYSSALYGRCCGRLFREFAVTLAVTIVISAVVSLTLTPMMASRILKHNPEAQQGRFYRASERVFDRMIDFYPKTLRYVLRYQGITLLVAVATLFTRLSLHHHSRRAFSRCRTRG